MTTKHFLTGATLLSGLLLLNAPLFAAVESDIVGYTQIDAAQGFSMLSVAFWGFDSKAATLSEIIEGDFQNGDIIQVYNKDAGGYWFYTYENGEWLDENFDPATKLFPPGTAFWVKTQNPTTKVTLKGVVVKGEYTQAYPQGMSMIATGVPLDLPLNGGIKWVGLSNADQIQIKNGNSYLFYTYENGEWLDEEFNPTTAVIPAGTSVWIQAKHAGASLTVQGAKD